MKLDSLLTLIISAPNFDHFTTSDLCSAYIFLKKGPNLDPIIIHRKLDAELLKLVKKGFLKKLISNKEGLTRFNKTALFNPNLLNTIKTGDPIPKVFEEGKQEKLIAKLNHYKAEFLLNIGESEAYKELYADFPDLVDEIQSQDNEARDNNTKILGKIRAIKSLLTRNKPVDEL